MSRIRGKDTKPELMLRHALHVRGFRYRLHAKNLPGRPDLVLPKYRAAVFVHGCFWHRHSNCEKATSPASRVEFWQEKFESNVARDKRNVARILDAKWRVAVVWQCHIESNPEEVARELAAWLPLVDDFWQSRNHFLSGAERDRQNEVTL